MWRCESFPRERACDRGRPLPLPRAAGEHGSCAFSQEACLQGNLIAICLEQLNDPHPLLRQWVAICLGRIWQNFDSARWCGVRDSAHEKLYSLLSDPIPEVSPPRPVPRPAEARVPASRRAPHEKEGAGWGSDRSRPLWRDRDPARPAGALRGGLRSRHVCGQLGGEDRPLDHHRPQRGHDAGPADQRREPRGPQGAWPPGPQAAAERLATSVPRRSGIGARGLGRSCEPSVPRGARPLESGPLNVCLILCKMRFFTRYSCVCFI